MLFRRLLAASAIVTSVHAFKNASPFFMLSSGGDGKSTVGLNMQSANVANAADVEAQIRQVLSGCEWDYYLVARQEGIRAEDFAEGGPMVATRKRLAEARKKDVQQVVEVGSVFGKMDEARLAMEGVKTCDAEVWDFGKSPEMIAPAASGSKNVYRVGPVSDEALPQEQTARSKVLASNDAALDKVLSSIPADSSYVLVYITTTAGTAQDLSLPEHEYEMDEPYPSALHQDLKRQLNLRADSDDDKSNTTNPQSNLPLFEKYQFLTPGLFMTLTVSLLLLIILYVGMTALSGLQVSYAAFSKEMGPQAQKPKQG